MKSIFLILLLPLLSVKQPETKSVRFDGLYVTQCSFEDDIEGDKQYLRFYPNGKVISIPTDCQGDGVEVSSWFYIDNKEIEYLNVGEYRINGNQIAFSTVSKVGIVEYKGKITKEGVLKLKYKSLINGDRGNEEFKFYQINNLP
ncbi:hypothetical protein [Flavobacterium sp.]|uniref:hypothetical protein n=1 Tax=Flavobacterium sp. TaxID=239 RepID=UPI0039197A47